MAKSWPFDGEKHTSIKKSLINSPRLNMLVVLSAGKYDDANVKLSLQPNPSMQKTNKMCLLRKIEGKCIKIMQDNLRWLAKS